MGGRGASSGISKDENIYGSQYHTVLESDNFKFVSKNNRSSEALMETMIKDRIYAVVGGNDLLRIISFDDNNMRNHVIERDKRSGEWHVHNGYFHAENGKSQHEPLKDLDKDLLEKVHKLWYDKKGT